MPRFDWRFMLPLLIAATLNPMNSAMLATVLVPIERDFPGMPGISAVLITTLYLTAAVAQPVLGGIADRIGARRTLLAGMAFLGIGAVLGAVAYDPWTLIGSRALIGFGTSAGFPAAVVMIRQRAGDLGVGPPARLLGLLAMASSASMAVGPPLGGLLAAHLGWRWVFLINLPLGGIAGLLAFAFCPLDRRFPDGKRARIDVPGITLFALGMSGLVLFMMSLANGAQWRAAAATIVVLMLLVAVERRTASPFIDVRLLTTNRPLAATYARHVLLNFALYCFFYAIPQWSQSWLHLPISVSGFVLLPIAVTSSVASIAPTRGRRGRMTEIGGVAALIMTGVAMMRLGPGTTLLQLMLLTLVFGIANGSLNMANQQRMLDYSPPHESGAAAGLLRTMQYCGAILSAPLTAFLLAGHLGNQPMRALAILLVPLGFLLLLLSLAGGSRSAA